MHINPPLSQRGIVCHGYPKNQISVARILVIRKPVEYVVFVHLLFWESSFTEGIISRQQKQNVQASLDISEPVGHM